jgi:DNA-binding transcriptional regulator YiaG
MLEPATIKVIRQKLGLTQSEFATFMGLGGNRRIREWELGEKNPNGTACVVLKYCLEQPKTDPFIAHRLQIATEK